MTTRISLPAHLAEYLYGKYGNNKETAIHLPDECDLYHLVYDLLRKRPENAQVDRGNVELYLPSPRESRHLYGKPVETYNYISERGAAIIAKKVNVMMKCDVHNLIDENKHIYGIEYVNSVYFFLAKYGIESITPEALLKDYQRWRQNLKKSRK